jgi:hypothetical protein
MVVTYLVPGPFALRTLDPLLGGVLIAGLFGALGALVMRFVRGGTSADQANTTSFKQIRERLQELDARLAVAARQPDPTTAADVACRRAQAFRAQIHAQLEQSGLDWVQATAISASGSSCIGRRQRCSWSILSMTSWQPPCSTSCD